MLSPRKDTVGKKVARLTFSTDLTVALLQNYTDTLSLTPHMNSGYSRKTHEQNVMHNAPSFPITHTHASCCCVASRMLFLICLSVVSLIHLFHISPLFSCFLRALSLISLCSPFFCSLVLISPVAVLLFCSPLFIFPFLLPVFSLFLLCECVLETNGSDHDCFCLRQAPPTRFISAVAEDELLEKLCAIVKPMPVGIKTKKKSQAYHVSLLPPPTPCRMQHPPACLQSSCSSL